MAEFSHHEPCPSCGSRDNVGVWEDGGKYCFGCGWGVRGYKGISNKELKQQLKREEKNSDGTRVASLPSDFDYGLPAVPLAWLRKYGITDQEIAQQRMGWSDARQLLVFPVFDNYGALCFCQSRYFGANESHPKYLTSGSSEKIFNIMDRQGRHYVSGVSDGFLNTLVLVEDHISAIRVSRSFPAMPLYGSEISTYRLRVISDRVTRLVIWLDRDKLKNAVKARYKALAYFNQVSVVVADKDPKEYNDDDIRRIVRRSEATDCGFSR